MVGVARARRNVLAVGVSGQMSVTVATCHGSPGALIRVHSLVTLVTLFEPRVPPIVVAVALPEPRFVVVEHP